MEEGCFDEKMGDAAREDVNSNLPTPPDTLLTSMATGFYLTPKDIQHIDNVLEKFIPGGVDTVLQEELSKRVEAYNTNALWQVGDMWQKVFKFRV